jgi:hypothetical protein
MNKIAGIAMLSCIVMVGCNQSQQADTGTGPISSNVVADLVFNVEGLT